MMEGWVLPLHMVGAGSTFRESLYSDTFNFSYSDDLHKIVIYPVKVQKIKIVTEITDIMSSLSQKIKRDQNLGYFI